MRMLRVLVFVLAPPLAAAQVLPVIPAPPGPDAPAFSTTSVIPTVPNPTSGRIGFAPQPDGRFNASGLPLTQLIEQAYGARPYQVVGAPDWARSARFEVAAVAPDGRSSAELMPMVRKLLADRFQLTAHVETRDVTVYALVVGGPDGRPAATLVPTSHDCAAILAERRRQTLAGGRVILAWPPYERPVCAARLEPRIADGIHMMEYAAGGQPISALVEMLAIWSNRHVIDRTGLVGRFDFDLRFSRQDIEPPQTDVPLEDAVQTLGLRLDTEETALPVLVIDRLELPTPD
jgi:uncharacterized protein (TIGR03435 family)